MFKRPVQPALQLRLRLGGTDVRGNAARFRDRKSRRPARGPTFVGMAAGLRQVDVWGASDTASRAAVYPCRSEYSSEAPSLES
jgi:hypothetical protein